MWAFAGIAIAALVMACAGALAYVLVDEPAGSTDALAAETAATTSDATESGLPTEVEPDTGGGKGGGGGGGDESVLETPQSDGDGSSGGGGSEGSSSSDAPELPQLPPGIELPPGVELPEGLTPPDAGVDSGQGSAPDSESDEDAGGVAAP